jgi:hypothetical protein
MQSACLRFLNGLLVGLVLSSLIAWVGWAQEGLRRVTVIPSYVPPSPPPAANPQNAGMPSPGSPTGIDDPAAELAAEQERIRAAYQSLNANNPLSTDQKLTAEMQKQMDTLVDPKLLEQIKQAQRLLDDPMIKRYLEVLSNPELQESAKTLMQNPRRKTFLYAQLAFFVIWLFLRSYQLGKARTFLKRVGVSLASFLVYLAFTALIIPIVFLGPTYWTFISQFGKIFALLF